MTKQVENEMEKGERDVGVYVVWNILAEEVCLLKEDENSIAVGD